jgi:hypothetical protein
MTPSTYLRYMSSPLLLALFVWGCGDSNMPSKTDRTATDEVHGSGPSSTYSLAFTFTEPLASSPASQRKLFLQFQLEEGGIFVVHTFATNKVEKGVKKLRDGLNLSFNRKGNTLRGSFVSCSGEKFADMPPLPDFDARNPVSMYVVIDNEKPQVEIYKEKPFSTPVLDTEAPSVSLNGELSPGMGTYWGVFLTQGKLFEARIED